MAYCTSCPLALSPAPPSPSPPLQRFALTLVQKRVALELYIKSHHEELRREVAASKSAAMTAATAKAVHESNAVADFARQITLSKKECAKWHAAADALGAELESLRAAAAEAAQAAGASASAEKAEECARLAGELAAKVAECQGLREVYEAEVASAVAAGEAAVARARADIQAEWAAEKAAAAAAETEALSAAQAAAQAPLTAALEESAAELAAARQGLGAAAERASALAAEAAALRARVASQAAEIEELEGTLEAESEENSAFAAKVAALEAALKKADGERAAWQGRWQCVDAKRAALLEQNLSLKGAIRVFARVRPALPGEETAGAVAGAKGKGAGGAGAGVDPLFHFPSATADDATELVVVQRPGKGVGGYGVAEEGRRTEFKTMHRVFPPTAEQGDVFAEVEGLVQSGAFAPPLACVCCLCHHLTSQHWHSTTPHSLYFFLTLNCSPGWPPREHLCVWADGVWQDVDHGGRPRLPCPQRHHPALCHPHF